MVKFFWLKVYIYIYTYIGLKDKYIIEKKNIELKKETKTIF